MACCNTESRKRYWIFGIGGFVLFIALILALLWPTLGLGILTSFLVLAENSLNYNNWIETPIPMYLEITMFNWTNSDQVYNKNVKPHFVEMGPYVFLESHTRDDIAWHNDNNTVSFNQTRTWHFEPDKSNGTLDDVVTNLNVLTTTTAYVVRYQNKLIRMITSYIIKTKGGNKLFQTKTVRELLFDGYNDPLLDFLKNTNSTIQVPFDKFGWFVERNGSSEYDGRFNMNTGQDDIHRLGLVNTWNDQFRVPYYRDDCGKINGTTGELWPPLRYPEDPVSVFVTDVCRTVTIDSAGDYEIAGIKGTRWIGTDRVFDNGEKYQENNCFCTADPANCPDLLPGVLNVSDCRYGAPAFVSFPHFYLADPKYVMELDGLNPTEELHQFSMALEPSTGIPLKVNARLQINILLQPDDKIEIFQNVPHLMTPMFWFEQKVAIDDELASMAKLALMLPMIGVWVSYGLAGIGALIILYGLYRVWRMKRSSNHERFFNEGEAQIEQQ